MDKKKIKQLNKIYERLDSKTFDIIGALFHRIFELESGWYSGQYHKNEAGKWEEASYPVPIVSVKGFCDIEIHFDQITVFTKLKRTVALTYSFEKFAQYDFEAYSVKYYRVSYRDAGQTLEEMKENIRASDDREIKFAFYFPFDIERKPIFEFVKLLRREGFYH